MQKLLNKFFSPGERALIRKDFTEIWSQKPVSYTHLHRSIPGLGGAFTTKEIAGGGALIDWGVHYLDIVMYCCGDPKVKTVTGEVFSKLGVDMKGYAYKDMWAGPPKYDGVYDVDDSVVGMIRTDGPVISLHLSLIHI